MFDARLSRVIVGGPGSRYPPELYLKAGATEITTALAALVTLAIARDLCFSNPYRCIRGVVA